METMKHSEEKRLRGIKLEKIMILKKEPVFRLEAWSHYSGEKEVVKVYLEDLKKAEPVARWGASVNTLRPSTEEQIELLYKNDSGCLIHYIKEEVPDVPSPGEIDTIEDNFWVDWSHL